ncbi:hypothetical protein BN2156_05377 [Mycolicibacterium neworleansense]|uniref:Uncharacterized protein n=1 Tax=Mycolicibacterium neworleansense TaxID=146018 RepID=A0A0H5SAR2_9MYCO|nr:hypothetical protein BN2156_05377 [Mycolicibacterium neworleansense]
MLPIAIDAERRYQRFPYREKHTETRCLTRGVKNKRVTVRKVLPASGVSATDTHAHGAKRSESQPVIRETELARRSLPDGVFGMLPGPSTTTLRGRMSTSETTSWAT